MDKFEKFYSGKTTAELLGQLLQHRITGQSLDPEWHAALLRHLEKRNLWPNEQKILDQLRQPSADTFLQQQEQLRQEIDVLRAQDADAFTVDPRQLVRAGKALKNMVTVLLTMFSLSLVLALAGAAFRWPGQYYLEVFPWLGILGTLVLLVLLHRAGNELVLAVKPKNKS